MMQHVNYEELLETSREGEIFLDKGADAVVWRSADGRFVRKQYLDRDRELAVVRARQEFDALRTARRSLAEQERVICPEPYGVDDERGELLLAFCDGDHLNVALEHDRFAESSEIHDLAGELAAAMTTLTGVLSLNQLDFSVRNTLVNSDSGTICLIDFTTRTVPRVEYMDAQPLEIAIASLLTSTITYQLHQSTLINLTSSRRLRRLARDTYLIISEENPLDTDRVRTMCWRFFWRQSVNRGWKRYIWFNTLGALAFRYLLHNTTTPATPPAPSILDERTVR